jgi:hypothetical protein
MISFFFSMMSLVSSVSAKVVPLDFDKLLVDFSIMYSPHELGCDTSATMRVTAYANGTFVETTTKTASFPGTSPVDTLRCGFPPGFDSVVVHYDSPPSCQGCGTIYMAHNMRVTSVAVNVAQKGKRPDMVTFRQNYPTRSIRA